MEKTDFSFWDNFSCKEYMDYINNIVFKSKYIPENVYEIEKGGLFGWLETKSSRRNDDADDDDNKRVRICNFFFVVKSIEYVIDASGNKTQYINVSIRRIFWDKDILSYDDPLDYKLTSNDIRSNAVFLRKIDVLFQIKSKQFFLISLMQ